MKADRCAQCGRPEDGHDPEEKHPFGGWPHPTRRVLDAVLEGPPTAVVVTDLQPTHTFLPELVTAMRADMDRTRQALANTLGIDPVVADRMWRHLNPGLARFYDLTDPTESSN